MFIRFIGFTILAIALLTSSALSQAGSLSGNVTSKVNGELVPGVTVEIKQLGRDTQTDASGRYLFENVPYGNYTVVTHFEGFSDQARSVKIAAEISTLDFSLSLQSISAEVTVTATGEEESIYSSFSTVSSLDTSGIAEKASTSVGEVLGSEAGVSVRSFGGGSTGRPSIRSFEGDRVLITQDGIRNGSIGSASGDHGEPISALNLERLEVIKGPATLLYGSNAIGGVVNAVSNHENQPHEGLRGYFTTFGGTVNRQAGLAGGIEYGFGKNIVELNVNTSREGDVSTPLGRIPNSRSRAKGGSASFGHFKDKLYFRGSLNLDRRRYGIPFAPLFESGEILSIINGGANCAGGGGTSPACEYDVEELKRIFANQLPPVPDEDIDIEMSRNNYRFVAGFRELKGVVTEGTFSLDFTDYQHLEIETADGIETLATSFFNDTFSYRSVFRQREYKKLSGQFGFEGYRRSYNTVGDEALIDGRVRQNNFGIFALQEIKIEKIALQFGARIESNRYNPVNGALPDISFTGFSGSIGARYEPWTGGSLIASFSSSYRPPALEELYNNGPHIGTVAFEVGDTGLTRERSNGIELSFRQNSKRLRFNGSIFYNDINNFIYGAPQDIDGDGSIDVEDLLPLTAYVQGNARYLGADASVEFDFSDNFGTFVVADIV
ncbi:MAG: TonB-dependent receptor, partial [Acidobacteriota bacterium]|nr:TonB-dependent receptor [Acidobacteriota bacterium]